MSPGARSTIRGRIKVTVLLTVDPSGRVTKPTPKSGASSRYFDRLATEAGSQWQFSPANGSGPRKWLAKALGSGVRARPGLSSNTNSNGRPTVTFVSAGVSHRNAEYGESANRALNIERNAASSHQRRRTSVASQSMVIFAARIFGAAVIFAAQAMIARFWGAEILGEYLLIIATVNLIAVVMPLGFETIGTYFAAEYRAKGEGRLLRGFMLRAYGHTALTGALLLVLGYPVAELFGEPGRALAAHWMPAAVLAIATAIVLVSGAMLVGLKKPFAGFFAETLFRITEEPADLLHEAPHTTAISRPDEVRAAREPIMKWTPGKNT